MHTQNMPTPMAILGAGSWGTALSLYLGRRGQTIKLWSIDHKEIAAMLKDGANNHYLPNILLPNTIFPTSNLAQAIEDVIDILIVVPSFAFKQTLLSLKPIMNSNHRIICATKGLDPKTSQLLSELTYEILGSTYPFAILSGPSFAKDVANGLPVAVDIACQNVHFLNDLYHRFNSSLFHIHTLDDVIGVEIGGVMKNIIAILTGISDGLKLGASARSALITFGLHDMQTLGSAFGAKANTFIGLSGMGDLILTCSDDLSRNRRFGLAIGQGMNPEEAEQSIGQVIEGKQNAELIVNLAKKHQLSLPLCEATLSILKGEQTATEALNALF